MHRRTLLLLGSVLLAATVLTGCGGSSSPSFPTIGAAKTYEVADFTPTVIPTAGKPTTVSFGIQQPDGTLMTKFKKGPGPHTGVHLIFVRSDLGYLIHLHPPVGADGKLSIPVTFPAPGKYRVVIDVYPADATIQPNFQLFRTITVRGAYSPMALPAPGGTVTVTLAGRDPDSPPQSLLYTLDPATLPGPVLDPVGGVLQWSIDSSLAPGRYPLTVRVADNGTPSLSATQTVVVTVVGATGPGIAVAAPTLTNGQLNLSWSSTPGTVYRVQFSSDLGTDAWTDVPGDIPATGIISTLSTPLSTSAPYRFYRVVVVP
jgi:hypothetical protein